MWVVENLHFFVLNPLNGQDASVGNGVTVSFEAPEKL